MLSIGMSAAREYIVGNRYLFYCVFVGSNGAPYTRSRLKRMVFHFSRSRRTAGSSAGEQRINLAFVKQGFRRSQLVAYRAAGAARKGGYLNAYIGDYKFHR